MTNSRFDRLTGRLDGSGLDAVALNAGPTLSYLTGLQFHLSERPSVLLVSATGEKALLIPELEAGKTAGLDASIRVFPYGENPASWAEVFRSAAGALGLTSPVIGVEPTRFRFLEQNLLQTALPQARFVSADALLSQARIAKDEAEVAVMREAVRIAQVAFERTLPAFKIGVTEREIASELSLQLLKAGSSAEFPFNPIVAGGPNSANPHAVPGGRAFQAGDLVVIDWGASYQGYISDLTRMVAFGPLDPELEQIHKIVLESNRAGSAAAFPGIAAGDIDAASRGVIERAGYGQYFIHRTGHGIGMEGHEPPYIFAGNPIALEPGMAFTVEPGIYLPGRGGVRIEDNLVITAQGVEVLTDLPRELFFIS